MPIVGKTDKRIEVDYPCNLNVIGRVWRGTPKPEGGTGKDLKDRFRVEIKNERWLKEFSKHYEEFPKELRIYLPYNDVDRTFETWFEAYGAGGLKLRCNGDRIVKERTREEYTVSSQGKNETRYIWDMEDVDKPCLKAGSKICPACGTKGSYRFYFYIRELYSAGMGSTKCFMMSGAGAYDLSGFHEQLRGVKEKYGSLTGSPIPSPLTFGFIPFILNREHRKTYRPAIAKQGSEWNWTGERTGSEAWTLSISEDPEWMSAYQRYEQWMEMQRLQLSGDASNQLLPGLFDQSLALPPQRERIALAEPKMTAIAPSEVESVESVQIIPTAILKPKRSQATSSTSKATIEAPATVVSDGDELISKSDRAHLWKTAQSTGYSEDGFRGLVEMFGFSGSEKITAIAYEGILEAAADKELAIGVNGGAIVTEEN